MCFININMMIALFDETETFAHADSKIVSSSQFFFALCRYIYLHNANLV